jgi:hypothetical protein
MIMATVTRTFLVDDLNGSTDDVSTVQFHLDKTNYEIDLTAANEARLRDKLARFLDAATPAQPPRTAPRTRRAVKPRTRRTVKTLPAGRDQTQAIRDWAKTAGYEISTRGRIPKTIQEAFDQAH